MIYFHYDFLFVFHSQCLFIEVRHCELRMVARFLLTNSKILIFNVSSGKSRLKIQDSFESGICPRNGKISGNSIAIKILRNNVSDLLDFKKSFNLLNLF